MTDRRRRIEALRAKAESTTFPAEAAALRAKADELAKALPADYDRLAGLEGGSAANWITPPADVRYENVTDWPSANVRFHGNIFEEMGGITVHYAPTAQNYTTGERVRVTDVNGRTYWVTVE